MALDIEKRVGVWKRSKEKRERGKEDRRDNIVPLGRNKKGKIGGEAEYWE